MTFRTCITEALEAKEIDPDAAKLAAEAYDEHYAARVEAQGPIEADRQAATASLDALKAEDLRKKQLRALTIRTRRKTLTQLAAFKRRRGYSNVNDFGGGGKPPKDGWVQGGEPPKDGPYKGGKAAGDFLIELVDGQGGAAGKERESIKGRYQALRGALDGMMASVVEAFETRIGFDTPGRAKLDNVVRELFGTDTKDAVSKGLADAWREASEYARHHFNAAGGGIGKLEDWGLPQHHDVLRIREMGQDAWVALTGPLLNRDKMIDRVTGAPFTDKRLQAVLSEIYDTIATEGANKREPGEFLGDGLLANRRGEERFLIFDGAEAWAKYQAAAGRSDPYAAMMHHLDRMSRDIAQMQVLGPNPQHQFDWLANFAEREATIEEVTHGAPKAEQNAASAVATATRMYGLFTGELAGAYGRENNLSLAAGAVRSALAGAQLGGAVINDVVSNPVFAAKTRAFTGLSAGGDFKAWAAHAFSGDARRTARRTGFIIEGARANLSASAQDMLRANTVGAKVTAAGNWFARRMPTFTYRMSLLSQNLAASRWAFQHEFMGALADRTDKTIADLVGSADAEDRTFGALLQARGFTEAEWATLGTVPHDTPAAGANFLSPAAIRKAGHDELSWNVAEMIERQVRLAVPEPSLWAQAHLTFGTRPGTIPGEIARSLTTYRSFIVTQTYLWSREMVAQAMAKNPAKWRVGAAAHAASLIIPLTISGALNIQLRELAKGNDVKPWDDAKMWGAAILQGGGLGIFGDFLYAAQARNGKTSSLTAMGSPAALVSDLYDLTLGNIFDITGRMIDKDDPETFGQAMKHAKPGRDAATFAARYGPVSSLWWARAAWSRGVVDQLQKVLDPDADEAFHQRAQRLERQMNQTQWWPYGSVGPARAPDLSGTGARR